MGASAASGATADTQQRAPSLKARLLPLDNGAQEIRALDGLRACAALSVVLFHIFLVSHATLTFLGPDGALDWYYLMTGVHLFFVLSGFLLFLPFARALLSGRPLPSAKRFYQRRALRILPAYWVCLGALVLATAGTFGSRLQLLKDTTVHVVLIHDFFPTYNRDFEGPLWTLAVEAQFYLLLPLLALGIRAVVGASRSAARLFIGIVAIIALALALRGADALVQSRLTAPPSTPQAVGQAFVLLTMGTQGKYLEVFAVGMLCAALYVVTVEQRRAPVVLLRRLAVVLLALGVGLYAFAVPRWGLSVPQYRPGAAWGAEVAFPLLIGLGYGAILLAVVWGNRVIRFVFEAYPLRFIGLISYSLYLWHLAVIRPLLPFLDGVPLPLRVAGAFVVAYLSYQFVERPFLQRRRRYEPAPVAVPTAVPTTTVAPVAHSGASH